MSTTLFDQRCAQLSQPDLPQTTLSAIILLWLLLSYSPQYLRIITLRSARGLSASFLLLGVLGGICGLGNIWVLPSSQTDWNCCRRNSRFACVAGLLGVVQIVVNFAFYLVLVGLFVYYERVAAVEAVEGKGIVDDDDGSISVASTSNPAKDADNDTATPTDPATLLAAAASATRLVHLSLAWALFVFTLCLLTFIYSPSSTALLANILGLTQMAFSLVMWLPQIYMTYSLGSLGALSATSLWLATPSTFVMLWSLWSRLGWKGWSAWIVVLVIGVAQVVLLGLWGVFFVRRGRGEAKGGVDVVGEEDEVEDANETTALLKGRSAVAVNPVAAKK